VQGGVIIKEFKNLRRRIEKEMTEIVKRVIRLSRDRECAKEDASAQIQKLVGEWWVWRV
jgi:hypothetical protein